MNNEKERREYIKYYSKLARPGNTAWHKIEMLQGYDSDYIPGLDDGEQLITNE